MAAFKKHKMYKGSKVVVAKSMKEHLAFKAKGYSHTKPKAKSKAKPKTKAKAKAKTTAVRKYKKGGTVKDACYHSVKARYRVFPSAYASGAIAKCRKRKAGKKK
jgi:hypothetical protein|tara:strand:+ start:21485 stop:21796 length:312 start_codon:yes stop_codon:yes gene_type:complete